MNSETLKTITQLEESLWRADTRLNKELMQQTFAADIREFGASGQTYDREGLLTVDPAVTLDAVLPLQDFHAQQLSPDVILVTYVSEMRSEGGEFRTNRSSIWCLQDGGWRLRFHQGTPLHQ